MHIELMPGLTNVIRFPIEERIKPTYAMLCDIAPDVREVLNVIDAFGIEGPPLDLRDITDRRVAEEILNQVPMGRGPKRNAMLQAILDGFVKRAVEACRAAHKVGQACTRAQEQAAEAVVATGPSAHLEEASDYLTTQAALRLVEAHGYCEEASGAARAVRLAREGQIWTRHEPHEDTNWLIQMKQIENCQNVPDGVARH